MNATKPTVESVPSRCVDPDESAGHRDVVDERLTLLERRLRAERMGRHGAGSNQVVSIGSRVVLEDLDDGTREEFVLVSSRASNPAEGRLSNESPVGGAISGHHEGDVVAVRAPRLVRRLRIVGVHADRVMVARSRAPASGGETRTKRRQRSTIQRAHGSPARR